jgi:hypothetical protein
MIDSHNLTKLFCEIDDFSQEFEIELRKSLLTNGKNRKIRENQMTYSEIMTIVILFHMSGYRCFKHFYLQHISVYFKDEFPRLLSYNRFVELSQRTIFPLVLFLKMKSTGSCSGITFIDSTALKVCHNKRIFYHQVFKGIAERGKSTMGWFFGFKLHLVVNDKGEIINFVLTAGNTDDRNFDMIQKLCQKVFGKLYGDKGYISNKLFQLLFTDGVHLITNVRSNMKSKLIPLRDKILLRKRFIIETINDQLKNISQIEHSRHRSFLGFMINLISGLIAYSRQPKKPSLNLELLKRINFL